MSRVEKDVVGDILPLSPLQQGFLFHYLKTPNSDYHFNELFLELSGVIHKEQFKAAWSEVVKENEMLRTFFRWEKISTPVQVILKTNTPEFIYYDVSACTEEEQTKEIERIISFNRKNRFTLDKVPFRVLLIQKKHDEALMIVCNHHILYDGWSNGIIIKDFIESYCEAVEGRRVASKSRPRFKEYLNEILKNDHEEQTHYWKNYLNGMNPTSLVFGSQLNESTERRNYQFSIDEELNKEITRFAKEANTTSAMLMYLAWGILLSRYSNRDDVTFGTALSTRNSKVNDYQNTVGLFINTLPLRMTIDEKDTVLDQIRKFRDMVNQHYDHVNVSLPDLKKIAEIEPEAELFNTLMIVENYPVHNLMQSSNPVLQLQSYTSNEHNHHDLTFMVSLFSGIDISVYYNPAIYCSRMVQQLAMHFKNIIQSMIMNPDQRIIDIDFLAQDKDIIRSFHGPVLKYDRDHNIVRHIKERAKKQPDSLALTFQEVSITYVEFWSKVSRFSNYLRHKGVSQGDVVGICMDRSVEMIVAVIAVLNTGGIFLPLSREIPDQRMMYMLSDADARFIIWDGKHQLPQQSAKIIRFSEQYDIHEACISDIDSPMNIAPDDLAYIIYTSGSTGLPKGVTIPHGNIVNLLAGISSVIPFEAGSTILSLSIITFDMFILEVLVSLGCGMRVVIADEQERFDRAALERIIKQNKVDILQLTPSLLNLMTNGGTDFSCIVPLKHLLVGGEAFPQEMLSRLREISGLKVYNMYGPTEATVWATMKEITSTNLIDIGTPLPNTKVFILDSKMRIQPIGVPGELCIAGDGISIGYSNLPEMTAKKFVDNPFGDGKIYLTGDLAKCDFDGAIQYIARSDHQVKVRGYRIELNEVENILNLHPLVKLSIVCLPEGDNALVAYIVWLESMDVNDQHIADIVLHAKQYLPKYMLPSYFVTLDEVPLTSNGKVNRKLLPPPGNGDKIGLAASIPPRHETDRTIMKLFRGILALGDRDVSIHANFFELGGHSLKAISLISMLSRKFSVEIPLQYILEHPTIEELSDYIMDAPEQMMQSVVQAAEEEHYPVTASQRRLFYFQIMNKDTVVYNMPSAIIVEGLFDLERAQSALNRVFEAHECLRTSVITVGAQVRQTINRIEAPFIERLILKSGETIQDAMINFTRPFLLNAAPLFRMGIYSENAERHYLFVDMHHIISDGISTNIIMNDFFRAYHDQPIRNDQLRFVDFALHQEKLIQHDLFKKQEQYWIGQFASGVPALEMPSDFPRKSERSYKGNRQQGIISPEKVRLLSEIAIQQKSTLFSVLLNVYFILLHKYSSQQEMVVGIPSAGRGLGDFDHTVGMFVNVLPIKARIDEQDSMQDSLKQLTLTVVKAMENQDYPMDMLAEQVRLNGSPERNSLFDTMFVFQNIDLVYPENETLKFAPYELEPWISKFDFLLQVVEQKGALQLAIDYSTEMFSERYAVQLMERYLYLIDLLIEQSDRRISSIFWKSDIVRNDPVIDSATFNF